MQMKFLWMIYLTQNHKELIQVYQKIHCSCHNVWVSLSFIGNHRKNTSMGPHLWYLSSLSSRTTLYLRSRSNSKSHNWPTKTLNRCPKLNWKLSHKTRSTQQWIKPLDMTSLSIMKTHIWHTISTSVELSTMWAPLCHFPTSKNRPKWCDVPSLEGCGDQMNWGEFTDLDPKPEELPNDLEFLLFFNDWPNTKLNPFLF